MNLQGFVLLSTVDTVQLKCEKQLCVPVAAQNKTPGVGADIAELTVTGSLYDPDTGPAVAPRNWNIINTELQFAAARNNNNCVCITIMKMRITVSIICFN